LVTVLLVLLANSAQSLDAKASQAPREGKVAREGFDVHYSIVGSDGPYVLILSGGPGEEIRSMQPVADELSKKYRCIMLEQRGTGRSKLSKYDSSTINLNAYIEDIEVLRKRL
jgi:proline iminopeptidase